MSKKEEEFKVHAMWGYYLAEPHPCICGLDDLRDLRDGYRGLREALMDTAASLAAAISLLERGSKKAAPSDKMFDQMLKDYKKSLNAARATLKS